MNERVKSTMKVELAGDWSGVVLRVSKEGNTVNVTWNPDCPLSPLDVADIVRESAQRQVRRRTHFIGVKPKGDDDD